MKTALDCLPCFLRQTVIALKQHYAADPRHHEIIREILGIIQRADLDRPPAYTTTFIHRAIRDRLGLDPFDTIKREYNRKALDLYPRLREMTATSNDPLQTAARLAIAGNIIDFGIYTSVDIHKSIESALAPSIAVDDYQSFSREVRDASSVLYLLDNAGEIVFDRILIEELCSLGVPVTAVVKGSAVLNDATFDDARQAGLDRICSVIDNGSDAIGTILPWTSNVFQGVFNETDFLISKGQGNYETVEPGEKKAYFLFQAKCDVVSRELGLENGAMLLKRYRTDTA